MKFIKLSINSRIEITVPVGDLNYGVGPLSKGEAEELKDAFMGQVKVGTVQQIDGGGFLEVLDADVDGRIVEV